MSFLLFFMTENSFQTKQVFDKRHRCTQGTVYLHQNENLTYTALLKTIHLNLEMNLYDVNIVHSSLDLTLQFSISTVQKI